jgi:hypothetical protein
MTTPIIEHIEQRQPRLRTREEAAQLLEKLRGLYQALSRDERDLFRGGLRKMSTAQRFIESEEF